MGIKLLEEQQNRDIQMQGVKRREARLPAAVTGKKKKIKRTSGGGFAAGGVSLTDGSSNDKKDETQLKKGMSVQILKGKYAGQCGTISQDPDSNHACSVKLDSGEDIASIFVDYVRPKVPV